MSKCKHGKEFGYCKYYNCVNNTAEDEDEQTKE